jgi:peptidoglycan hydrolase-like protein with peptidoglycan-binding domain
MFRTRSIILVLVLFLAACGTGTQDRAISGGGIGAAAGAVVGAITGLTVLEGALIGTGLGAAFGGLTDAQDINLGQPIWRQYSTTPSKQAASSGPKTSNMVAATQANLARLGYEPGPIDGQYGLQTAAAISQFQRDQSLPADGKLSGQIALEIEKQAAGLPE